MKPNLSFFKIKSLTKVAFYNKVFLNKQSFSRFYEYDEIKCLFWSFIEFTSDILKGGRRCQLQQKNMKLVRKSFIKFSKKQQDTRATLQGK